MDYLKNIIGQSHFDVVLSAIIFLVSIVVGLFLKIIILGYLSRAAAKTSWKWDEPIVKYVKSAILFWCILMGLYFIKEIWVSTIPTGVNELLNKVMIAFFGLSVLITIANIATALIGLYAEKLPHTMPLTNLTQNLVKILIIIIGGLMILSALGISITPLLTTLGIGGLAVALALQDTLSNFFSGFYTTIAKNIRIGDFIKLESGEEGYVLDIGWRVTRIKLLGNNIVLIPNNKLAQSVVRNYYLPDKELSVPVEAGVHYNSDLGFVEKVTLEVAREIQRTVDNAVKSFEPIIRYHTFDSSSINFTVIMRAEEIKASYLLKHEFIKRLHQRYKKEGIVIPYPIRAINLEQEKSCLLSNDVIQ
ncbi:MAG: mechanosensitive ion channel family protein [Planctomycetota bacterium]